MFPLCFSSVAYHTEWSNVVFILMSESVMGDSEEVFTLSQVILANDMISTAVIFALD